MNARTLVLVAVSALALPAGALGKGPVAASVSGPELDGPIAITGYARAAARPRSARSSRPAFRALLRRAAPARRSRSTARGRS
jgi:hypothetical protein